MTTRTASHVFNALNAISPVDASAIALLGVIAREQVLPLVSFARAANDEGYDTDLRTAALAWELDQLVEAQRAAREYSQDSGALSDRGPEAA